MDKAMVSKFTLYPRMETNMYSSIILFSKPIRPLHPLPLPIVPTPSPACPVFKELTVQRKIVQQKKPFNERKLNVIEKERVGRVQGMIAAHEQGLRRLQRGRKQAIETRRALDRIMKRVALQHAETKEASNEAFSYLIARQKEKQKELRDWVGSLKESGGKSRALMQKMMSESVAKSSVKGSQDGGALGLKVETAVTARANDTESTDKSGNERSRSNSDPRCQGNTVTSRADMMAPDGINQETTPSPSKRRHWRFGDTKTIKMKFSPNNKLVNTFDHGSVEDGFYVDL
ncbi:unnamed protein product [Porites evermanni]|uniref:Uncharacterized protein n=1 Tax=Porites evermanni TaxID=104178 RepID=A0ABN8LPQ1_9CNID|nr:unnamed protein product [Porites evermanni]